MMDYVGEKLKVRKSILIIFLIVLLIFFYNNFVKVAIGEFQSKKDYIVELENQLSSLERRMERIDKVDLQKIDSDSHESNNNYKIGLNSHFLLMDIDRFANEVGLLILEYNSLAKIDKGDFFELQHAITLAGNYNKFLQWLKFMEEKTYYIDQEKFYIEQIAIKADNTSITKEDKLSFKVTINSIDLKE